MAAFVNLKNISTVVDACSIVNSNFGGPISYIKLCLKIATVMQECIKALEDVPDKDKEDMLQNVKSLQENLQKIEHLQLRYDFNDREIKRLHSQLQSIENMLKYLNNHVKKNWLQKIWCQMWSKTSVKSKFSAMEAKMNLAIQKSTHIETTFNLELTASLEQRMALEHEKVMSELEKIKAKLGGLDKKMTLEYNALTLQLSAVVLLKYDDVTKGNFTISSPDPPRISHIEETQGKLFVKWQTLCPSNKIDFFALCYDEEEKLSLKFKGNIYEAAIGPPEVELIPEKLYTVKICAVSAGIQGRWRNSVVQKFTKPCPRQPDCPKISSVSSSAVKVMVTPPKQACPTESPVTQWEIEYAMQSDQLDAKEWTPLDTFQVEHEGETESIYVFNLASKETHCFRVKAKNSEGWSDYSRAVSFEMTHSYISYIYTHTQSYISYIYNHFYAAILMAFLLFFAYVNNAPSFLCMS